MFLAQAKAADKRYNGDENPNYGNAISGPINNAKRQKAAQDENEARIAAMPGSEDVLTDAEAAAKAREIMQEATGETGGLTREELLGIDGYVPQEMDYRDEDRDFAEDSPFLHPETGEPMAPHRLSSFYFGYTGRRLVDECLRFLTVRGASHQDEDGNFVDPSKRNRPVLLWPDGSTISMGDAEHTLGFKAVEVYASTLKVNARKVEDALQRRYQRLPLGLRLWRCVDKGSKYDKEIDGKVHKVFITHSRIAQMLAERKIKVNF